MGTPNAEPRSAIAFARPVAAPVATAPGFSRGILTGAMARPVTAQDSAQARNMLTMAQQRPGQPMRPMPVPPNRGGWQGGYVQQPGYVQQYPQYQQPLSFGLSIGPNGVQLGVNNGVGYAQQAFAQDVIIANAYGQRYYLKAGYPVPAGCYVVDMNPGFWAWLTTPNAY